MAYIHLDQPLKSQKLLAVPQNDTVFSLYFGGAQAKQSFKIPFFFFFLDS